MTTSISKLLIRATCRWRTLFLRNGGDLSRIDLVRRWQLASASNCKPLGEGPRQTGFSNFLLRGHQIIFYPQQFDQIVLNIVDAVSRAPVTVAWLPHAACVDEILPATLDANVFFPFLPYAALVPNKNHGHMGVAEKTDGGALIRETRDGV